jgi:hypothetical protein
VSPSRLSVPIIVVLSAALYWLAIGQLSFAPRRFADLGTTVKLPIFVDVALAGGDRYLAANISTVRAMVAFVEPQATTASGLQVIAALQKDVSRLNPGHEDNYYLAAASLVGTTAHQQGQWILRRAIDARPFDLLPPFLNAVNRMHHDHDVVDGAHWLQVAAGRSPDDTNRTAMEKISARWLLKGADPEMAAAVLDTMAVQARNEALREHFSKRAQQARDLFALQQAMARYAERFGHQAKTVDDLITTRIASTLPQDPFGNGYEIRDGIPMVRSVPGSPQK